MKHSEIHSLQPLSSYTGRVKNGVVVFDGNPALPEGQIVRIEPVNQETKTGPDMERIHQLEQLFVEWTEEDGKLSDEEADCLQIALRQNRGLHLQIPKLD